MITRPTETQPEKMDKQTAIRIAREYDLPFQEDYLALKSSVVTRVIEAADKQGYRKPVGANGSRGRCFFEAVRRAILRK